MALKLTDEQLNWLVERIPDRTKSLLGGRPPEDKSKVLRGIFWMLDDGAKWKDLPRRFGSKSTVHRWFQTWVREGVFEKPVSIDTMSASPHIHVAAPFNGSLC